MRSSSPARASASASAPLPASTDPITASSTGESRFVACVVIPEIPAGSVVLFSEAVMHGTAPWRADHERRTLLYKYCVSQMAWSRARVLPPPDVPLTPRQQALLTEPADPHTFVPSLFSDGPGVER